MAEEGIPFGPGPGFPSGGFVSGEVVFKINMDGTAVPVKLGQAKQTVDQLAPGIQSKLNFEAQLGTKNFALGLQNIDAQLLAAQQKAAVIINAISGLQERRARDLDQFITKTREAAAAAQQIQFGTGPLGSRAPDFTASLPTDQFKRSTQEMISDVRNVETAGIRATENLRAGFLGVSGAAGQAGQGIARAFVPGFATFAAASVAAFETVRAFQEIIAAGQERLQTEFALGRIFHNNSEEVKVFARAYAESIAATVTGVEQLENSFGRVSRVLNLTQEQIRNLARISANVAAETGLPVEDVAQKIQRAFIGQPRGLGTLGIELQQRVLDSFIRLNEGIDEHVSKMELTQRAQVAYNALLSQTAQYEGLAEQRAQATVGAFDRFHASISNLAGDIGAQLVPAIASTLDPLTKAINAIDSMVTHTQAASTAFRALTFSPAVEAANALGRAPVVGGPITQAFNAVGGPGIEQGVRDALRMQLIFGSFAPVIRELERLQADWDARVTHTGASMTALAASTSTAADAARDLVAAQAGSITSGGILDFRKAETDSKIIAAGLEEGQRAAKNFADEAERSALALARLDVEGKSLGDTFTRRRENIKDSLEEETRRNNAAAEAIRGALANAKPQDRDALAQAIGSPYALTVQRELANDPSQQLIDRVRSLTEARQEADRIQKGIIREEEREQEAAIRSTEDQELDSLRNRQEAQVLATERVSRAEQQRHDDAITHIEQERDDALSSITAQERGLDTLDRIRSRRKEDDDLRRRLQQAQLDLGVAAAGPQDQQGIAATRSAQAAVREARQAIADARTRREEEDQRTALQRQAERIRSDADDRIKAERSAAQTQSEIARVNLENLRASFKDESDAAKTQIDAAREWRQTFRTWQELGFAGPPAVAPGTPSIPIPELPGRQRGGPVDRDKFYVVGEDGPEIFAATAPGHIIPADSAAAILASGGAITGSPFSGTTAATNPQQIQALPISPAIVQAAIDLSSVTTPPPQVPTVRQTGAIFDPFAGPSSLTAAMGFRGETARAADRSPNAGLIFDPTSLRPTPFFQRGLEALDPEMEALAQWMTDNPIGGRQTWTTPAEREQQLIGNRFGISISQAFGLAEPSAVGGAGASGIHGIIEAQIGRLRADIAERTANLGDPRWTAQGLASNAKTILSYQSHLSRLEGQLSSIIGAGSPSSLDAPSLLAHGRNEAGAFVEYHRGGEVRQVSGPPAFPQGDPSILAFDANGQPIRRPPAFIRTYHGTESTYEHVDPEHFREGMTGEGYYTTTDPRVAGGIIPEGYSFGDIARTEYEVPGAPLLSIGYAQSRYTDAEADLFESENLIKEAWGILRGHPGAVGYTPAEAREFLKEGFAKRRQALKDMASISPQVRAVNIPKDLPFFDLDKPLTWEMVQKINTWVQEFSDDQDFVSKTAFRKIGKKVPAIESLQELYGPADTYNAILEDLGYAGIKYRGGQNTPMYDEADAPIFHDVYMVYRSALGRIQNAFSGRPEGRQFGGPVKRRRNYIVGEDGPEVFAPGEDGHIIPRQYVYTAQDAPTGSSTIKASTQLGLDQLVAAYHAQPAASPASLFNFAGATFTAGLTASDIQQAVLETIRRKVA